MECKSIDSFKGKTAQAMVGGAVASLGMWFFFEALAPAVGLPRLDLLFVYGRSNGLSPQSGHASGSPWVLFLLGGLVFAGVYAVAYRRIPLCGIFKGMTFGMAVYLYATLIHIPLTSLISGAPAPGWFGVTEGGMGIQLTMLSAHIIYGAVLGMLYRPIKFPMMLRSVLIKGN